MSYLKKEVNKRILIVDDEIDVLDFLKIYLESLNWEITIVSSTDDAFEILGKTAYFLIITDIAMPEMDGYEFINQIKDRGIPSQLALMTGFGYNPRHTLVKIYKTNRYPCLFKPFNRNKVSEAVLNAWKVYHEGLLPDDASPDSIT